MEDGKQTVQKAVYYSIEMEELQVEGKTDKATPNKAANAIEFLERTTDQSTPERLENTIEQPDIEMPPEEPMETHNLKYKEELIEAFHIWKMNPLENRRRNKTFTIIITNKSILLAVNAAIDEIISEHRKGGTVMNMAVMNTLYYITALTLEGEKD